MVDISPRLGCRKPGSSIAFLEWLVNIPSLLWMSDFYIHGDIHKYIEITNPTISWISPSGWLVFPWSPSGLPSIFYGSTGPFEITPGASEWCREVSRGGWEDLGRGRGVANFSVAKSQDPPGTDGDFWRGWFQWWKVRRFLKSWEPWEPWKKRAPNILTHNPRAIPIPIQSAS